MVLAPLPMLSGKRIGIFIDFSFEDLEVTYPKVRLEEEGAVVLIIGAHKVGTKYTGKFGYPVVSTHCIDEFKGPLDALILPGGFAPDYMRRNAAMLTMVSDMVAKEKPVASICHGPWMLCSARDASGAPVVRGRRATAFVAIKDDLVNAGAVWEDAPVVVDGALITARTPADLTPFCHAIIDATADPAAKCGIGLAFDT